MIHDEISERDLPTIEQILQKADSLHDQPMAEDESAEWFEATVRENRVRARDKHE
jgi:hypothetical protein